MSPGGARRVRGRPPSTCLDVFLQIPVVVPHRAPEFHESRAVASKAPFLQSSYADAETLRGVALRDESEHGRLLPQEACHVVEALKRPGTSTRAARGASLVGLGGAPAAKSFWRAAILPSHFGVRTPALVYGRGRRVHDICGLHGCCSLIRAASDSSALPSRGLPPSPEVGAGMRWLPWCFRRNIRGAFWSATRCDNVAEREGFEPPVPLRVLLISSQAHSTRLCHLSAFG